MRLLCLVADDDGCGPPSLLLLPGDVGCGPPSLLQLPCESSPLSLSLSPKTRFLWNMQHSARRPCEQTYNNGRPPPLLFDFFLSRCSLSTVSAVNWTDLDGDVRRRGRAPRRRCSGTIALGGTASATGSTASAGDCDSTTVDAVPVDDDAITRHGLRRALTARPRTALTFDHRHPVTRTMQQSRERRLDDIFDAD